MQQKDLLQPNKKTKQLLKESLMKQCCHIQFVPTVIIDEHIFDESITPEELSELVK